jgi:hypothetical protein
MLLPPLLGNIKLNKQGQDYTFETMISSYLFSNFRLGEFDFSDEKLKAIHFSLPKILESKVTKNGSDVLHIIPLQQARLRISYVILVLFV